MRVSERLVLEGVVSPVSPSSWKSEFSGFCVLCWLLGRLVCCCLLFVHSTTSYLRIQFHFDCKVHLTDHALSSIGTCSKKMAFDLS